MLTSAASEIMKYDQAALHALKFEGKTAAIQKAVREAKTFLDKYFMARATRERGMVAGGRGGQGGNQGGGNNGGGQGGPGMIRDAKTGQWRKATLDELASEPTLINSKYQ